MELQVFAALCVRMKESFLITADHAGHFRADQGDARIADEVVRHQFMQNVPFRIPASRPAYDAVVFIDNAGPGTGERDIRSASSKGRQLQFGLARMP